VAGHDDVAAMAGLRRASAADVSRVIALQQDAYARNRPLLGVEPLPLTVDYVDVLSAYEVWLAEAPDGLAGVLILEPRPDDVLLWSVATAPRAQGRGLGNRLLAAAEARAWELGRSCVRLYTGEQLVDNIAWYERHGYARERIEQLADRRLVHLVKHRSGSGKP
jgi:ribosomal protein S18 acetylase RimI-like enzyme